MENTSEIQNIKNRFGIIGNAPALNYALSVAIQVAPTDLTVMINGESGSGKESFSKIIHSLSRRNRGPFIAINCGALPEGTIDSELFGHVKGSFTGAVDHRKGYFETTDNGTIFLDEVGELPLGTQARLLRVLENGEFISVGSSTVKKTDVRIITATNANLLKQIEEGKFREDLYYRLNTVPIKVPPLRDRGFDIELLFIKFTTDFAENNRIDPVELTEESAELLRSFRFPGNIRQLKNISEQITLLSPSRTITRDILEKYLPKEQSSSLPALLHPQGGAYSDFSERELLYKVLFDMKKDITELKKLVYSIMSGSSPTETPAYSQELFQDILISPAEPIERPETFPAYPEEGNTLRIDQNPRNYENVEDISHVTDEEENLSLEKNEKEMIIKALRRNNFKRKYAAQSLGISERTLYRKIKQYDIVDEK